MTNHHDPLSLIAAQLLLMDAAGDQLTPKRLADLITEARTANTKCTGDDCAEPPDRIAGEARRRTFATVLSAVQHADLLDPLEFLHVRADAIQSMYHDLRSAAALLDLADISEIGSHNTREAVRLIQRWRKR